MPAQDMEKVLLMMTEMQKKDMVKNERQRKILSKKNMIRCSQKKMSSTEVVQNVYVSSFPQSNAPDEMTESTLLEGTSGKVSTTLHPEPAAIETPLAVEASNPTGQDENEQDDSTGQDIQDVQDNSTGQDIQDVQDNSTGQDIQDVQDNSTSQDIQDVQDNSTGQDIQDVQDDGQADDNWQDVDQGQEAGQDAGGSNHPSYGLRRRLHRQAKNKSRPIIEERSPKRKTKRRRSKTVTREEPRSKKTNKQEVKPKDSHARLQTSLLPLSSQSTTLELTRHSVPQQTASGSSVFGRLLSAPSSSTAGQTRHSVPQQTASGSSGFGRLLSAPSSSTAGQTRHSVPQQTASGSSVVRRLFSAPSSSTAGQTRHSVPQQTASGSSVFKRPLSTPSSSTARQTRHSVPQQSASGSSVVRRLLSTPSSSTAGQTRHSVPQQTPTSQFQTPMQTSPYSPPPTPLPFQRYVSISLKKFKMFKDQLIEDKFVTKEDDYDSVCDVILHRIKAAKIYEDAMKK